MDKIIEKLYDLQVNTESLPFGEIDKRNFSKEWELYNFLHERLPSIFKKDFIEYVSLRENRYAKEMKEIYEQGFKTAITLITESLKQP